MVVAAKAVAVRVVVEMVEAAMGEEAMAAAV